MTIKSFDETYSEMLHSLADTAPDCITYTVFGKSHIGREIPALRLGDTADGGHRLLYVGGITGSPASTLCLIRFVRDYADAIRTDRRIAGIDISYLHHTRAITVVPLLNPDGALLRLAGNDPMNPLCDRLRAMRTTPDVPDTAENPFSDLVTNGRGVDLRRNCEVGFAECVRESRGIGHPGFPGMHPESEPECAAVCRYLRAASVTDLALLFDDTCDKDGNPVLMYAGGTSSCGGDRRTAGIASILARDIDAKNCHTVTAEIPGSFGAWYKTLGAGPMLTLCMARNMLSGPSPAAEIGGMDTATACALLRTAAGYPTAEDDNIPGMTLFSAELALHYGKIRRALFHGTVL